MRFRKRGTMKNTYLTIDSPCPPHARTFEYTTTRDQTSQSRSTPRSSAVRTLTIIYFSLRELNSTAEGLL